MPMLQRPHASTSPFTILVAQLTNTLYHLLCCTATGQQRVRQAPDCSHFACQAHPRPSCVYIGPSRFSRRTAQPRESTNRSPACTQPASAPNLQHHAGTTHCCACSPIPSSTLLSSMFHCSCCTGHMACGGSEAIHTLCDRAPACGTASQGACGGFFPELCSVCCHIQPVATECCVMG